MKSTLYPNPILIKLEFPDRFSTQTQILIFMKILHLGAELFHVDGRTDITRLTVFFAILGTRIKMRGALSTVLHLPS
jgi:hypothetical protein